MCATKTVTVESRILKANEDLAAANRARFVAAGVTAINFMSAPGAGKTTLLEQTLLAFGDRAGVIEGDLFTEEDALRIRALGIPAHQITTGSVCHLDARMISQALDHFNLDALKLLCIENVGNMVCPAEFDLGERFRVMVYSAVEGAEKPRKYPVMFHTADAIVLNKIDLIPYAGVSLDQLIANVRAVNPRADIFPVSCRSGVGLPAFAAWLEGAVQLASL